jgi:hypothetical protein
MITVAAFWWRDPAVAHKARYTYTERDVLALKNSVARYLRQPHRFVCVTSEKLTSGQIEAIPLDMTTFVPGTRYAKLQLFKPDVAKDLGERILYLDLDTVPVNYLDPLVDRDEDLVLFRNPNFTEGGKRAFYNTSVMLIRAGSRPEFWTEFDPVRTPAKCAKVYGGSDQAWISIRASRDEAYWDHTHGVYGAGRLGDKNPDTATTLPENARLVLFPGNRHLSQSEVRKKHPWIDEHRVY